MLSAQERMVYHLSIDIITSLRPAVRYINRETQLSKTSHIPRLDVCHIKCCNTSINWTMLLLPFLLLPVALMANGVDGTRTPLVTRTTNMTNKVVIIRTSSGTEDKIVIVPQNDISINVCTKTSTKRNDLFTLDFDAWGTSILQDGWHPKIAYIVRYSRQDNRDTWYAVSRFCEKHFCILMISDYYLGVLNKISIEENNNFIKLDLSMNNIEYIYSRCFQKLKKLEVLYLLGNKIKYLKIGVFDGLDKIREINVAYNGLLICGWGIFSTLGDSLAMIDLSHNKDLKILEGCFNSSSLRKLDLSYTGMGNIDQTIFKGVPNLELLDLSSNEISDPSSLALRHLIGLDLSGNRLAIINSTTFKNLPELQYLDVRENKIMLTIKSGATAPMKQLKELNLVFSYGIQIEKDGVSDWNLSFPCTERESCQVNLYPQANNTEIIIPPRL